MVIRFQQLLTYMGAVPSNITKQTNKKDLIQAHGGTKFLFKCLNQFNSKILSLAVSILGVCSMNEWCRIELLEYGVIENLGFIMKKIKYVDTTNYHICLIIANLTETQNCIPIMHRHNIPSQIVKVLSNTKCGNAIAYSAIRALRKIWENSSDTSCKQMLNCKAIRVVSKFLSSKNKKLVAAVLKAQVSFLTNSDKAKYSITIHVPVIFQIIGSTASEQRITINTLVHLLHDQKLASKIIYLMCRNCVVREKLGKNGLLNHIIEFLITSDNHYLKLGMCHLLKCQVNQYRFSKLEHGTNVFMKILGSTDPILKKFALHTLEFFLNTYYPVLTALIKTDLIPLLIKDLSLYVKTNKMQHAHEDESKFQSFNTDSTLSICTCPARTSYMSPTTSNQSFDTESVNADESKSDIGDIIEEIYDGIPYPLVNSTIGSIIIESLTNIMYIQQIDEILRGKDVWETIFDYIQYIRDDDVNLNAIKILQRITCEAVNFDDILFDGFILSIHQKLCRPIHDLDACKTCRFRNDIGSKIIGNATNIFQSPCAGSVMCVQTMKRDRSDTTQKLKTLISVTAPLVVTCPEQLIRIVYYYKGYINLCNIILNDQNPSFGDAVGAIMSLFKTLQFIYNIPKYDHCKNNQKCGDRVYPKENNVTLVMDDGTLIDTNKSFLSLKSPMFEAMFRYGNFREAYENTIHLKDVTSECFNCLLGLLDHYCECKLPTNIDVFFELIIITEKYMLNELCKQIYPAFLNYITVDNCSLIYKWVKESDISARLQITHRVDFEVIKYLLHSNSRFSDRVKAIQNISRNHYGQHFIDDLSIILKLELELSIPGVCNPYLIKQYVVL